MSTFFVRRFFIAAMVFSGAFATLPAGAQSLEKVTVRFTWKFKGEYAPLCLAVERGYFKQQGLDVELAEGSGAQTVFKLLASGSETFGYGPAIAAASAISAGLPLRVVALYQTSTPMGVISFPDVPLKSPKDLEGKRLAISVGETFSDMLAPFAKVNDIDLSKVRTIQMDGSARNAQFLQRNIDVMSVYISNELPVLENRTNVKFNVINVADYGLRLNGASIITSLQVIQTKPELIRKLLAGIDKGYRDAMADPKAAADAMTKYMKVPEVPEVLLRQVQATMASTNAPAGKPIGWQSSDTWASNLALLKETGAVEQPKAPETYFTNEFLP